MDSMNYIRLGQITKTRGLQGEFRVYSLTDFAKERFKKGAKMTLFNEKTGERIPVTVRSFHDGKPFLFLAFEEFKTIEEAEPYLRYCVEIDEESAPIPEGYYRYKDLIGCKVLNAESKEELGTVSDLLSNAPTKTLRIERKPAKDFFVPFNDTFIKNIDLENKTIEIEVWEGML